MQLITFHLKNKTNEKYSLRYRKKKQDVHGERIQKALKENMVVRLLKAWASMVIWITEIETYTTLSLSKKK